MRKHINSTIAAAIFSTWLLSGCAATTTAISKRNLDVQTKMSDTVFLDPVAPEKQTVFVQVKNTTDQDLQVNNGIKSAIQSHGYKIVEDPNAAHYMLQASILQVGKSDLSAAQAALARGYGGAVDGAATGMLAAAASGANSNSSYAGAGLAGAVIGTIANAAVKDVTFTMITDLQISERAPKGVVVNQETDSNLKQGSSTRVKQNSKSISEWKRYRTRIVSTANKVNLEFSEAQAALENGLVRSVSGIF